METLKLNAKLPPKRMDSLAQMESNEHIGQQFSGFRLNEEISEDRKSSPRSNDMAERVQRKMQTDQKKCEKFSSGS